MLLSDVCRVHRA